MPGPKKDTAPNAPQNESDFSMSFPDIGEEHTSDQTEDTVEARLAAAEEKLARAQAQQEAFDQERQRWQQTIDKLISGAGQGASQRQPDPPPAPHPEIRFDDLPDPVDKPQEFKQALGKRFLDAVDKRVNSQFEQFSQRTSQQRDQAQRLDDVWQTFQERYGDLAQKRATLNGAIIAERDELQRQGVDPVSGILSDPDGFIDKVANRMRAELGPSVQDEGQEERTPYSVRPNRTAGVAGGSNLNGRKPGGQKEPMGFIEQMKQQQERDGLI